MPSFREHGELLALWERYPAVEKLEPGAGRIALTFDDGPERDATPAVLDALDVRPVYWSAWGQDWDTIAAERIAELVTRDLSDGAIVLLHDSPRYADRPSAEPTATALTPVAAQAVDAGLTLVTLSDALNTPSAAS